jgi:hypothetical protein
MSEEIKDRIEELKKYVDNLRTIITGVNKDIENGTLVPDELQKTLIVHTASQGRKALADIEKLEKLKNSL